MRFRRCVGAGAVGLLVLLLCGCGTDAVTALRTLGSWAATGAMLGHAWADGATPRAYTEHTLERARRELGDKTREIATLPAPQRTAVTPITERAARSLGELAGAVRADDRAATRTLAADARHLVDIAERARP